MTAASHQAPIQLDARLRRTRRALSDALVELLETQTFDDVSIRQITARAAVGYATFYRHYASKEDLLHEVAAAAVDKLVERATPIVFTADMRESCRTVCALVEESRGLWRALLTGTGSGVVREEFVRRIRRLRGRYTGVPGPLPAELQLICATGATLDILAWWLSQQPSPPAAQVVDMLDHVISMLSPSQRIAVGA